jgi:WD40 repeat protein
MHQSTQTSLFQTVECMVDSCCFRYDIPVELRMIIQKYAQMKTILYRGYISDDHHGRVYSLLISPSDDRLYSGSRDQSIRVWRNMVLCGRPLKIIQDAHQHSIRCLFRKS